MESSLIQRRAYWKSWDFDGPESWDVGTSAIIRGEIHWMKQFLVEGRSQWASREGGVSRWRHGRESALILLAFFSQTKIYKFQNVTGPSFLSFFLSPNSSPYACPRLFPSSYLPTNPKLCFHQHQARNVMRQTENMRLCSAGKDAR